MSGKEFGPDETPPPYSPPVYQPQGQAYPGGPGPVIGQPYGQPSIAPQYGYTNAGFTTAAIVPTQMMQSPPPDHFCLAVFVTLCCFWPTGIMAIMKASDARTSASRGDMVTAHAQARSAKQMINASIGIGIVSLVIVGVIIGVYVGLVLNSDNWDDY